MRTLCYFLNNSNGFSLLEAICHLKLAVETCRSTFCGDAKELTKVLRKILDSGRLDFAPTARE